MNFQTKTTARRLLLPFLMLLTAATVQSQTYVIDKLKPSSERHYSTYSSKKNEFMTLGGYDYSNGFIMRSGRAGFIASNQPGFIVFDLPSGYEKMSFVLGPLGDSYLHSDENNAILVIKADGKKVLDKVVHVYDAPQEIVLNIKASSIPISPNGCMPLLSVQTCQNISAQKASAYALLPWDTS